MAIFHFKCSWCGVRSRLLLEGYKNNDAFFCLNPTCFSPHVRPGEMGQLLIRTPEPPSASVKERLDNGLQARVVERIADAERIFRERSKTSEELKEKY